MGRVLADLTPLRASPPFRRLWAATGIGTIGQQVMAVAVALQVYQLTESSLMVGLVGVFQLVPLVIMGLYGGSLSDAFDRRKVALLTAIGTWTCAAAFVAQSLVGLQSVWLLYALVAVHAGLYAVGSPAYRSIIPRLVPVELLPATNALGMMTFTLGFTLGPLLCGGIVAATGTVTAAYALDFVMYAAAVWAMWRLPAMPPVPTSGEVPRAGWRSVAEGIRFLRGKRNLQMSFYIDIVAMVFGAPRALFPAIATLWYADSLAGAATVVGLLSAAPAVGALVASVLSGPLGRVRRHGLAVVICVLVWGVAVTGFGLVRVLPLALLLLVIAGGADTVSAIFRNTIMQASVEDDYRGRLSGIYTVVVAGGSRAGDVEAGLVAGALGEAVSVVSGGIACLIGTGLLVAAFPAFLRYDARHPVP